MPNRLISIVLIVAYPLLVHISLLFEVPTLLVIAPIVFLFGVFWHGIVTGKILAWSLLLLLSASILLLDFVGLTLYLLYLPPVLIPLLLLIIFGRTLRNGREPLITAIGEAARGPLTLSMRKYTHGLTLVWCLVFLGMLIWSAILPWLKEPELWSWFTNVINYGLVGVLFVGEFMLRKLLFPAHDHPSFLEYLRIIARSNIRY